VSLWIRFLIMLLRACFGRRLRFPDEASVLHGRVLPNDLDLNVHMTNSRYLAVMDLGRVDFGVRTRLLGKLLARRGQPVVGGMRISFRRPLAPLQRYRLETAVIGWTEHVMIFRHRFLVGSPGTEEVAAEAEVRTLYLHAGRKLPVQEVLEMIGYQRPSPSLDEALAYWAERPRPARADM